METGRGYDLSACTVQARLGPKEEEQGMERKVGDEVRARGWLESEKELIGVFHKGTQHFFTGKILEVQSLYYLIEDDAGQRFVTFGHLIAQ